MLKWRGLEGVVKWAEYEELHLQVTRKRGEQKAARAREVERLFDEEDDIIKKSNLKQ